MNWKEIVPGSSLQTPYCRPSRVPPGGCTHALHPQQISKKKKTENSTAGSHVCDADCRHPDRSSTYEERKGTHEARP